MTIHERMVARSEREKDLLKYGRSQEKERIIKLLEDRFYDVPNEYCCGCDKDLQDAKDWAIALIKGEK